jgi:hypothetical protein
VEEEGSGGRGIVIVGYRRCKKMEGEEVKRVELMDEGGEE